MKLLALLLLALLIAGIAATFETQAHHPGSHAVRVDDQRVRLTAVVTVADTCTDIAGLTPVAHAGATSPGGARPVTVRLSRDAGGACAPALTVRKLTGEIPAAAPAALLHLYVVAADGKLLSTERVRIERS